MSKRTPYLEIALTVAVMAFLVVVIAGGFNQRGDDAAQVTMHAN
jgi:hypothetical protein